MKTFRINKKDNGLYEIGIYIKFCKNHYTSNKNYAKYLNVSKEKIMEIFNKYKTKEELSPTHILTYTYFYNKEDAEKVIEKFESIELMNELLNKKRELGPLGVQLLKGEYFLTKMLQRQGE